MKKATGLIISSGGIIEEVTFKGQFVSLEEMQEIVKGYIEFVYLPKGLILVVNEEGKNDNLPINKVATVIANITLNDIIVGETLLISNKFVK